jgi:hypothetical protein
MVVWVLGTMVQIQASSSEKEFSVNDLESHQILRIRFTPEKPVFNELETIDAMATLGSRDSKPIISISSEFFHKKTAPAAFILYNQKELYQIFETLQSFFCFQHETKLLKLFQN